jgi:hypothetical protein
MKYPFVGKKYYAQDQYNEECQLKVGLIIFDVVKSPGPVQKRVGLLIDIVCQKKKENKDCKY